MIGWARGGWAFAGVIPGFIAVGGVPGVAVSGAWPFSGRPTPAVTRSGQRRGATPARAGEQHVEVVGFSDHHGWLLSTTLAQIEHLDRCIAHVDQRIEHIAQYAEQMNRPTEIPGVNETTARLLIAEVGLDMTRFPTHGHLAS